MSGQPRGRTPASSVSPEYGTGFTEIRSVFRCGASSLWLEILDVRGAHFRPKELAALLKAPFPIK